VASRARIPCIYVLAGANGAGKSSVAGAMLAARGAQWFDPDEAASHILRANPGITQAQANSAAWHQGRRLLERAIAEGLTFAFETTLEGHTIAALLDSALTAGIEVRIWFVGLASVELHIARVRARVAKGGHHIPEAIIRERYDRSRLNLIQLMPKLTELRVYDNSEDADPDTGAAPRPKLLLHMARGKIVRSCDLATTPAWAKPILLVALRSQAGERQAARHNSRITGIISGRREVSFTI
jgi:predicted ABC-type ATPase